MFEALRGPSGWGRLWGGATIALAVLVALMTLWGTLLARHDFISKLAGFEAIVNAGYLAAAGVVLGAVALSLRWRLRRTPQAPQTPQTPRLGMVGLAWLVCAADVGFLVSRLQILQSVPAIHDISTDLQDPPAFVLLADKRAEMSELERPNWRIQHRHAYGDVTTITLQKPVATLLREATLLARERGWRVVTRDQTPGMLEATASVSWIQFQDDVVIRVRAIAGTPNSRVDMRSRSRIGASDLGTNAERIREFLQALEQAAAAPRLESFAASQAPPQGWASRIKKGA
jgi:uncharacterized protein (DUF1499 family)